MSELSTYFKNNFQAKFDTLNLNKYQDWAHYALPTGKGTNRNKSCAKIIETSLPLRMKPVLEMQEDFF